LLSHTELAEALVIERTASLSETTDMLRLIIEAIPVRVFWKGHDLRYLGCNTLFARDAGRNNPQELVGRDDFAMGWKDQAELYREDDRQVMESRRPKLNIIEPQTTPTGAKIWLNTSKVVLQKPDGEVFGVLGVYEDITERKQAEEAFQVLVNQAPMGIFIVQDGKFQLINPGFEKISGYAAGDLLGCESMRLVSPDYRQAVREHAIKMLKGEPVQAYEFPIITKCGETRWVMETVTSTLYRGKRASLGYFIDISEHRSLEAQLLQARKMEAVGTLAGGIAHDFNNILTAILGNIGLAILDDKMSPRVRDRLAQAEQACLRAQSLSQQLLTFAKGGAPVKKIIPVAKLLTESIAFTCAGSAVRVDTSFPEDLWSIEADPGQIGQIFQNLTINAIQAMPTGGTIKVRAENLTLGTDRDLPLEAGKYLKITVQDQGIGIAAQHLPRIFDPYFTTKQKGSGLGLASTYAIVKKHHGHISVESKQGVGTTFQIYLPASEQPAAPQPAEDTGLPVGEGKILVMDDEEMVREVLGRMLGLLGYGVELASDGGEAIERFVQAQKAGQAFAAVILDLTVPAGLGGKDTVAKLRQLDPRIKAIVSSGYSDDPIMADFRKYGFSGVIAKPYKISEVGRLLQEVVMGSPKPGSGSRWHTSGKAMSA
jgi:PAS domain S-box-containing protein